MIIKHPGTKFQTILSDLSPRISIPKVCENESEMIHDTTDTGIVGKKEHWWSVTYGERTKVDKRISQPRDQWDRKNAFLNLILNSTTRGGQRLVLLDDFDED